MRRPTYIQHPQSCPFGLYLRDDGVIDDVFPFAIPPVRRPKSSTVDVYNLPIVLRHFLYHVPLLESWIPSSLSRTIPPRRFALQLGFSSLHEFHLEITDFSSYQTPNVLPEIQNNRDLDFLESALANNGNAKPFEANRRKLKINLGRYVVNTKRRIGVVNLTSQIRSMLRVSSTTGPTEPLTLNQSLRLSLPQIDGRGSLQLTKSRTSRGRSEDSSINSRWRSSTLYPTKS
jgi:hypothetical protein